MVMQHLVNRHSPVVINPQRIAAAAAPVLGTIARSAAAVLALFVLASCAALTDVTPKARAELAPTGKLRAAINYGNTVLATKDISTGELRGVAIDLAQEVGRRLGVQVEFIGFANSAEMGDAAPSDRWDIAFLGADPERDALMSFTPAYLQIEATYLVKGSSPLRMVSDVDRDGVRVAARARDNYELFLKRNLKQARLISAPTPDAAFDLLRTDKVDALAGLTQSLLQRQRQLADSRVLAGRFMAVEQCIAVPKGRNAALIYLRHVVEDAKASGLIARAIEATGVHGVSVAPPTN